MANVFKKYQQFVDKPNRNVFDMSFVNNFTTDFGRLTPVFCKEVLPGDSVNINASLGLNFAPMLFPVQTKMKAHLHFFYVRTRSLWKDWMDFIGNTKDGLVPPYIDFATNKYLLKTGSLADYLGVPTTLIKPTGLTQYPFLLVSPTRPDTNATSVIPYALNGRPSSEINITPGQALTGIKFPSPTNDVRQANYQFFETSTSITTKLASEKPSNFRASNFASITIVPNANIGKFKFTIRGIVPFVRPNGSTNAFIYDEVYPYYKCNVSATVQNNSTSQQQLITATFEDDFSTWLEKVLFLPANASNKFDVKFVVLYKAQTIGGMLDGQQMDFPGSITGLKFQSISGTDELEEAADMTITPYEAGTLPISALPFRAYEAIYNSFYRNPQNNPFFLNGKPEYNKYITNDEGGKDSTPYDLFKRNWEDDAYTTAVQSPQQGIAPLVGVSSTGEFTFQDENGTYKAQAKFGEDGETISSIDFIDNSMPSGTTRALIDLVSSGISINDFRNVNALQRWLEKNMRRGLRYKDQIMSHFGADVKYDELLMPEFIGGTSQDVDVNRVINTAQSDNAPLGAFGGLASAFGGSRNNITHYADEHGFVIGILSVVPYANYSQVLPKMFTRNNVLDYYFPEFGSIGMQPITNRDFMPLQCYREAQSNNEVKALLVETFGYQRPWWDYISAVDEVHGNYRNLYRDYLLNRVFGSIPKLTPDFLTIDSNDLNDIFAVTDEYPNNTDKVLGCIRFDFKKKTTIPEYGIPKLEVQ